ncbi:replication/maintenance protein RepL [Bacillales bacterium AN1005]
MARRNRGNEGKVYWGAIILEWFEHLQDNDLTSADYKVLFFLCQKMNISENIAYVRQKQIAEELNMDKGNVSKCIKRLSEKQFIIKSDMGFMINPNLFYIGKSRNDRFRLRDNFDILLDEKDIEPRFYLNEDDYILEEYPNRGRVQENTWSNDSMF